ncbi:hypothetical protein [Paraburkholderia xenovorans]|uniref:hypothetical protein n=1 Tax=Paraburkholderia xenovorans TaxID=36873 RepID=UPI00130E5A1D|nr:hypothetical protein [Paraburkholderia xenovorans]
MANDVRFRWYASAPTALAMLVYDIQTSARHTIGLAMASRLLWPVAIKLPMPRGL